MKTFVIDDDPISNLVTELTLRINGFTDDITIFESAEDALACLISTDNKLLPKLILLDINMPIVDGWQFLDRLRHADTAAEASYRIFILTSSLDIGDQRRAETYKPLVLDIIQKPINNDSLLKIREHLHQ